MYTARIRTAKLYVPDGTSIHFCSRGRLGIVPPYYALAQFNRRVFNVLMCWLRGLIIPVVGAEGGGGEAGLVVEVADGALGEAVAHGHGLFDFGT